MTLAEKLRYLREVEGSLRGLARPMTQQELVRAIRKEQGKASANPTFRKSKAACAPT